LTAAQENLPGSAPPVDPAALQTLMCRAGLAVAVLDGTGRLSMLSPGLEHLLQRAFTAAPAESLAEVFHLYSEGGARLLQPHEVPIVRASRGEVVEDAIVTVRAPGQPVRHLRVNATPIAGPNGERQGAWAVMTDVTSLAAAARGELSRTLAETVNHNLRTPLTTILCHAELLLDHQADFPPDATRSLKAVWRAGQRLNDMVTSISEWIDLAYTPGGEGRRAELAELASLLHPNATLDPAGTVAGKVRPDDRGPR
jgi:signal transduction histidine kinase